MSGNADGGTRKRKRGDSPSCSEWKRNVRQACKTSDPDALRALLAEGGEKRYFDQTSAIRPSEILAQTLRARSAAANILTCLKVFMEAFGNNVELWTSLVLTLAIGETRDPHIIRFMVRDAKIVPSNATRKHLLKACATVEELTDILDVVGTTPPAFQPFHPKSLENAIAEAKDGDSGGGILHIRKMIACGVVGWTPEHTRLLFVHSGGDGEAAAARRSVLAAILAGELELPYDSSLIGYLVEETRKLPAWPTDLITRAVFSKSPSNLSPGGHWSRSMVSGLVRQFLEGDPRDRAPLLRLVVGTLRTTVTWRTTLDLLELIEPRYQRHIPVARFTALTDDIGFVLPSDPSVLLRFAVDSRSPELFSHFVAGGALAPPFSPAPLQDIVQPRAFFGAFCSRRGFVRGPLLALATLARGGDPAWGWPQFVDSLLACTPPEEAAIRIRNFYEEGHGDVSPEEATDEEAVEDLKFFCAIGIPSNRVDGVPEQGLVRRAPIRAFYEKYGQAWADGRGGECPFAHEYDFSSYATVKPAVRRCGK